MLLEFTPLSRYKILVYIESKKISNDQPTNKVTCLIDLIDFFLSGLCKGVPAAFREQM